MAKQSYPFKPQAVSEADVKEAVKTFLASQDRKIFYYMPVQAGYGKHGIPDFVCCVPTVITQDMVGTTIGVFIGIETKAPGKLPTPKQADCHAGIRAAHGVVVVVDTPAKADNCV